MKKFKKMHLGISVDGYLNQYKKRPMPRILVDEDGKKLSSTEVREYFKECQAKGWKLLPSTDECKEFDHFGKGCPGHEIIVDREYCRNYFKESGLTYESLDLNKFQMLKSLIALELQSFNNSGFTMKLIPHKKADIQITDDLKVSSFSIRCSGQLNNDEPYFTDREAITFNHDGFIGFAGWADGTNVTPFLEAFEKWVDEIKPKN